MLQESRSALLHEKIKSHRRLTFDILDGMVDWVRVIDNNGIIIYANKSMEEALGKDIVGTRCYSALGKSCACKRCITETTISTGQIAEKEEIIGDRIFSVKSSPVRDLNDNIYAAVEVFRDVTRERKLEKEILKRNEKMSKDLFFARTIQKKVLPQKGDFGPFRVDYSYKPSEMLSGDIFDIYRIDDNHTGIYISDVVGHGITAAIMTMFIRQTIKAIKYEYLSPSKAISELHKRFLDLNLDDDKYFTIFYGVFDNRDNSFRYTNGGHNCIPLHFRENKVELLEAKGYPITYLFNNIEYEEQCVILGKGDSILFYTDGVIEARNEEGEFFGLNRLVDIVKNSDEENLITEIENNVDRFNQQELDDDFALLKIKII